MIGFFRRPAALLAALLLVAGLAPGLTVAQQGATKSAPPALIPPVDTQAAPATPAPAAVPAAPAPMKAAVSTESVENPYGLEALWRQAISFRRAL